MKLLKYKNRPKYQVCAEEVNLLVEHLARIGGKTSVTHIKSALQALSWNPCDFSNPPKVDWGEVINVAVEAGVIKRGPVKYGYQSRIMIWLPHVDPTPQKMARKALVGFFVSVLSMALLAVPCVTKVDAKQRYPWNGLVDITVTLSGTEEECTAAMFPFYVTNKTTRAELPIGSVKAVGSITGAGNTWTRRFIWNATADVGCAKFGEVELTVGAPSIGVQLWENGPHWAECNVGALKPEEYGYYFWWGDTVGYKRNSNNNGWISVNDSTPFSFSSVNSSTHNKSVFELTSAGCIDAMGNLVASLDAATAHLGMCWRMPTDAELSGLINNCTATWAIRNGVNGMLVTGKGDYASKSIFLPAAGYGYDSRLLDLGSRGGCWLSAPCSDRSGSAWSLDFGSGDFRRDVNYRYYGQSVRPVREFAQ